MIKGLNELAKEFIVEDDIEHESIKELVTRILNFCKIDKNGFVIIFNKNLRLVDKILLILAARYLGNRLQQKLGKETTIQDEISVKEIVKILNEKENVITARLTELKNEKKILSVKRGLYKISPYIIENFLTELESGVKSE